MSKKDVNFFTICSMRSKFRLPAPFYPPYLSLLKADLFIGCFSVWCSGDAFLPGTQSTTKSPGTCCRVRKPEHGECPHSYGCNVQIGRRTDFNQPQLRLLRSSTASGKRNSLDALQTGWALFTIEISEIIPRLPQWVRTGRPLIKHSLKEQHVKLRLGPHRPFSQGRALSRRARIHVVAAAVLLHQVEIDCHALEERGGRARIVHVRLLPVRIDVVELRRQQGHSLKLKRERQLAQHPEAARSTVPGVPVEDHWPRRLSVPRAHDTVYTGVLVYRVYRAIR